MAGTYVNIQCVCLCVCIHVCACACACVRVCVCVCACIHKDYTRYILSDCSIKVFYQSATILEYYNL